MLCSFKIASVGYEYDWFVSCQGLCEQAISVLQIMEAEGIEPNIVMLNMLINAFGNAGRYMEAMSVYHHIKESVSFTT